MRPLISVCLPVYNGALYLSQALDSLQSQTLAEYEVIAVDDQSTDGSWEMLQKYAARDSRLRIFRNAERQGLFANYNLCMQKANSEFIKPFAQDDLLHPLMLKTVVEVLNSFPEVSLVSTKRRWIDELGRDVTSRLFVTSASDYIEGGRPTDSCAVIERALKNIDNFIGEPSVVAFRTTTVGAGFDEKFYQLGDFDFWLRLLEQGSYYFVNQTLCEFRSHSNSTSRMNVRMMLHAIDIMRLARTQESALQIVGSSEQQFIANAMPKLAKHLLYLVNRGSISFEEMRRIASSNECSLKQEDFLGFQELAFHALVHAERQRLSFEAPSAEKRLRFMERRLNSMLRSPSWQSTVWLRKVKSLLVRMDTAEDTAFFNGAASNEDYANQLRRTTARVKCSLSWRGTKPLRTLEKKVFGSYFRRFENSVGPR